MYVYTDDDLTRINRDYLGPKGKRLPWVATYRTYVVSTVIIFAMFGAFLYLRIPANKWTILLWCFLTALIIARYVRQMNRDLSIYAALKGGWQEVTVPRNHPKPPEPLAVGASISRWSYDAQPEPKRWGRRRTPRKNPHPA